MAAFWVKLSYSTIISHSQFDLGWLFRLCGINPSGMRYFLSFLTLTGVFTRGNNFRGFNLTFFVILVSQPGPSPDFQQMCPLAVGDKAFLKCYHKELLTFILCPVLIIVWFKYVLLFFPTTDSNFLEFPWSSHLSNAGVIA